MTFQKLAGFMKGRQGYWARAEERAAMYEIRVSVTDEE
jgi:hypothetical protein